DDAGPDDHDVRCLVHGGAPYPTRLMPGGRFGAASDSATVIRPSTTVTSWTRTGRLAGGWSASPVRRLDFEACSGHSASRFSTQPSASGEFWCVQVSSMAKSS